MATQPASRPNWFASGPVGQFLASTAGRAVRIVAGLVLIGGGLWLGGIAYVAVLIGFVPLLAGTFDKCVVSRLFGGPSDGASIRALGRH